MEASSSAALAQHTLLSCGLILAVGTLAAFVAQKIRIPDVAIFLIAGIVLGPHALGLVNIPAASALNEIVVLFGASYILFDGGAALRLDVLKQVWITIVVIATLGVADHGRHHRPCRASHPRPAADRGAAARRDAGLHRPGNADPDLPPDQDPRPRRANRDERVRLQRRHGRHPDLHACSRSRPAQASSRCRIPCLRSSSSPRSASPPGSPSAISPRF